MRLYKSFSILLTSCENILSWIDFILNFKAMVSAISKLIKMDHLRDNNLEQINKDFLVKLICKTPESSGKSSD